MVKAAALKASGLFAQSDSHIFVANIVSHRILSSQIVNGVVFSVVCRNPSQLI